MSIDVETTKNFKLGSILEKRNQRDNRQAQVSLDDCNNKRCAATQFSQIQKKQITDLQELLERYCNVLSVFGFNSAK